MNKFYMNGKLTHKASNHNTKRCELKKLVFLPHSNFERLKSNPYQEHEAITGAKDLMYENKNAYHCIMLLDEYGDVIIDRLCDNDNLSELNMLCGVLDSATDRDSVMRTILDSDVRCINGIKRLFVDRFIELSDKLVLNTRLERKPTELASHPCVIEKAIPVSHSKFKRKDFDNIQQQSRKISWL